MKHRPSLLLALPLLAAASTLSAQSLIYTQNFDSLSLGALPTSPNNVFTAQSAPANTTANIIDFNGGRAIRLVDNNSTGRPSFEHNFVADANSNVTTVRFDFTVRLNDVLSTDSNVMQIGLGAFNTSTGGYFFSTPTARNIDVRLMRNGKYVVGGQTSPSALTYGDSGVNFSLFVNAGTSAVDYTGPDSVVRSLAASKYSLFINDTLAQFSVSSTQTSQWGFASANTTGLGRLSFGTGTSNAAVSLDFTIDNLAVYDFTATAVPEPSSFAAASGLAVAALAGLRRRRR